MKERLLTHNNEELTIREASKRYGISVRLISDRLRDKWSIEKALTTPKKKSSYVHWRNDHQIDPGLARQVSEGFTWDNSSEIGY